MTRGNLRNNGTFRLYIKISTLYYIYMESIWGYLDVLDYIYDMGILGGVKSRRRLHLRVCISVFFFLCTKRKVGNISSLLI